MSKVKVSVALDELLLADLRRESFDRCRSMSFAVGVACEFLIRGLKNGSIDIIGRDIVPKSCGFCENVKLDLPPGKVLARGVPCPFGRPALALTERVNP